MKKTIQKYIAYFAKSTLLTLGLAIIPTQFAFADFLSDEFWANANAKSVKQAVENGQNPNKTGYNNRSPLMYAVMFNTNPKVIETLIDANANVHAISKDSWTSLMVAARYNPNPKVLEVLLDEDSNLRAKDTDGKTALMIAAQYNKNPAVIEFLLDEGANPTTKSNKSYDTLRYMQDNDHIKHSPVYWKLKAAKFDF